MREMLVAWSRMVEIAILNIFCTQNRQDLLIYWGETQEPRTIPRLLTWTAAGLEGHCLRLG